MSLCILLTYFYCAAGEITQMNQIIPHMPIFQFGEDNNQMLIAISPFISILHPVQNIINNYIFAT
eukprot:9142454-Ditylum_brightwellii.AAC.1